MNRLALNRVDPRLSEQDIRELIDRIRSQCADARAMVALQARSMIGMVDAQAAGWEDYLLIIERQLDEGLKSDDREF